MSTITNFDFTRQQAELMQDLCGIVVEADDQYTCLPQYLGNDEFVVHLGGCSGASALPVYLKIHRDEKGWPSGIYYYDPEGDDRARSVRMVGDTEQIDWSQKGVVQFVVPWERRSEELRALLLNS